VPNSLVFGATPPTLPRLRLDNRLTGGSAVVTNIESAKTAPPEPWGIIATTLWALLPVFIVLVVEFAAGLAAGLGLWPDGNPDWSQDLMSYGGVRLSWLVSPVVQVSVLAWASRRRGWQATDYLGWVVPSGRDTALAFAAIVAFVLTADAITYLLDRNIVTPFEVDIYRSAHQGGGLVLLWIAVVIALPIGAEIMLRGFLYRGWARTPRAVVPAVVIISALEAISQVHYDWFVILQFFLSGLVLGWARWRSGSTMLTFAMHALINTWGMVATTVKLNWLT